MIRRCWCAMVAGLLLILSGTGAGAHGQEKSLALVVASPEHMYHLAALSISVLAVYEDAALVEISEQESRLLFEFGMRPVIVDVNSQLHEYYLLYVSQSSLEKVSSLSTVLDYRNGSALLRASSAEAQEAARLGFGLTRLYPHFLPPDVKRKPLSRRTAGAEGESFLQSMADDVSGQEITATIRRLQDFQTRYSCTDSCQAAAEYLYERLASFGLSVSYDSFLYSGSSCSGQTWRNVVAVHPGLVQASQIYILCGHYDSINYKGDSWTIAPGADDNASGTAGVVEAARVLSAYDFDASIYFICFSGEEEGLIGSYHYAEWASGQGLDIRGVINLDMIAYVDDPPYDTWDIDIYGDSTSQDLAHLLGDMIQQYSEAVPIEVITANPQRGSDHYPFALKGYEAVFAIDAQLWSAPDWNPHYHSAADTLGTLDVPYATEVVKGVVAAVASLAGTIGAADVQAPTMETIAEPQGQYSSRAPVFSLLRFDDETALDDGWYQIDSCVGTWQALFANVSGTSWSDTGWTVPGFSLLHDGSHTIYFKARDDAGHAEGESGEWSWQFHKDASAPVPPVVSSPTHPSESRWYAKDDVTLNWTEPYDLSGVIGYSFLLDQNPMSLPDATLDGTTRTFAAADLADGIHYFHCRALDNIGLWGQPDHFRIRIDTQAPPAPLKVMVDPAGWTNVPSFHLDWSEPADLSGIGETYYKIGAAPISGSDGEAAGDRPVLLTVDSQGSTVVYVWFKDKAGNADHHHADSTFLFYDATPPDQGTISIAADADTTSTLVVTLNGLSAQDALSGMGAGATMRFSNDGWIWSSEEPFDSLRSGWNLSLCGGTKGSGGKQVFVQYQDAVGNWSLPYRDDIICSLPLEIAAGELPSGTFGFAYDCTLSAAGGWPPYTWEIVGGTLPGGLGLDSLGLISGVPDSVQLCPFAVLVRDEAEQTQQAEMSIAIAPQSRGDVNGDGHIDVVDVVLAIQIILEMQNPLPVQMQGADCSGEGLVDIIDTICIVNIILYGE